jgi:hypothetical protein
MHVFEFRNFYPGVYREIRAREVLSGERRQLSVPGETRARALVTSCPHAPGFVLVNFCLPCSSRDDIMPEVDVRASTTGLAGR